MGPEIKRAVEHRVGAQRKAEKGSVDVTVRCCCLSLSDQKLALAQRLVHTSDRALAAPCSHATNTIASRARPKSRVKPRKRTQYVRTCPGAAPRCAAGRARKHPRSHRHGHCGPYMSRTLGCTPANGCRWASRASRPPSTGHTAYELWLTDKE